MAQQKEQKRQKATDNKSIINSVAIVTNRNFKEIYNKRVTIEEVSNGIAKVQVLESDDICYHYVPLKWLKVLSDKESIEAYMENCYRKLEELFDESGDLVKRASEQILEGKIEYDKDGNINNNGKKPSERQVEPQEPSNDSADNFFKHIIEASELLSSCSKFCRDYKVSPIYFVSRLSEHLYSMHERYALKFKK